MRPPKQPAVYILASGRNETLYIGVTSDIVTRISAHKQNLIDGFTKRYNVHSLVYFEFYADMPTAIRREKQLKKWLRSQKVDLIERHNPGWRDLYGEISGLAPPGQPGIGT
jgi:putative endonuclease